MTVLRRHMPLGVLLLSCLLFDTVFWFYNKSSSSSSIIFSFGWQLQVHLSVPFCRAVGGCCLVIGAPLCPSPLYHRLPLLPRLLLPFILHLAYPQALHLPSFCCGRILHELACCARLSPLSRLIHLPDRHPLLPPPLAPFPSSSDFPKGCTCVAHRLFSLLRDDPACVFLRLAFIPSLPPAPSRLPLLDRLLSPFPLHLTCPQHLSAARNTSYLNCVKSMFVLLPPRWPLAASLNAR